MSPAPRKQLSSATSSCSSTGTVQHRARSLGQLQDTLPRLPTGFAASPVHPPPPETSGLHLKAPSIDTSGVEQGGHSLPLPSPAHTGTPVN